MFKFVWGEECLSLLHNPANKPWPRLRVPRESPQLRLQLEVHTADRMSPRNAAWFLAQERLCPGSMWKTFTPFCDVDIQYSCLCNMEVHYQLENYYSIIKLYLDLLHWCNRGDSSMLDFWDSCLSIGKTWGRYQDLFDISLPNYKCKNGTCLLMEMLPWSITCKKTVFTCLYLYLSVPLQEKFLLLSLILHNFWRSNVNKFLLFQPHPAF